ncbi:MAG TPA: PBP1A family penicillin-binding protein [Candidatus Baltobacteraceae bacterium]|nr:PBP1A family penicillin-binding protein [Candidatus Baltobacteraceae bacterium]
MTPQRTPVPASTRILRSALLTLSLFALALIGMGAGMVSVYSQHLPDINRIADYQPVTATRIFARDGTLLANLYRDQDRIYVPISRIPPLVRYAFIATEDRSFLSHHGIDYYGIFRALVADLFHQKFQGASTITQQLARRLFLSNEVSITRKMQEALLAIEIEHYYTKDEILERYLNLIYLGSGAYGIEAAAHIYFGTDVGRLTLPQAAMIAGLPAAPSNYSPYVSLERAKSRQRHVLDRLASDGYITHAQADAAYDAPLNLAGSAPVGLFSYKYPYFTTFAINEVEKYFGADDAEEGGLHVDTTLDPRMQRIAEEAVHWGAQSAKVENIDADQAALVAIRPGTGEILAMVGGANAFSLQNQFNRAWQAQRQPGSSFKVFVYTAAIDNGKTPQSIVEDEPSSYPNGDGTLWSPTDDDHRYLGAIPYRMALALSRNVAAVHVAHDIGIDRVLEYAQRMGIRSKLQPDLSLALGSNVVTPLDMASAYGTVDNAGIRIEPTSLRLVRNSIGEDVLDKRFPVQHDVISAGTAYVVMTMLESVIQRGTGYPNALIGRPEAGKTGTTSDFRDAWFVGFTPDLVTAVWLGNDNYHRMTESYGGNIPARIWARFMKAALEKTPPHDFLMPAGEVVRVPICGSTSAEYFRTGTEPGTKCTYGWGANPWTTPTPIAKKPDLRVTPSPQGTPTQ